MVAVARIANTLQMRDHVMEWVRVLRENTAGRVPKRSLRRVARYLLSMGGARSRRAERGGGRAIEIQNSQRVGVVPNTAATLGLGGGLRGLHPAGMLPAKVGSTPAAQMQSRGSLGRHFDARRVLHLRHSILRLPLAVLPA